MSSSLTTVEYIDAQQLASLMQDSDKEEIMIVDVREGDYTFGKVRGSVHIPFHMFEADKLLPLTKDKTHVIFHCYYSQTRGPTAAKQYLHKKGEKYPNQKVFVLEGGFKNWKNLFQNNPSLYESIE